MDSEKIITEKTEQIVKWAESNDNTVRYQRVVDILYDKNETITESKIAAIVAELENRGIAVVWEADEDYGSGQGDVDDFIPANVSISQRPMNVYNLMERLENEEINLTPEFQRNRDLWSPEKQSRLIESLMLKIPIPTFYFNASDDEKWTVIEDRKSVV